LCTLVQHNHKNQIKMRSYLALDKSQDPMLLVCRSKPAQISFSFLFFIARETTSVAVEMNHIFATWRDQMAIYVAKPDAKSQAAKAAIDQAYKLLQDMPQLKNDQQFMMRLKDLEAAHAAYVASGAFTSSPPTMMATAGVMNPFAVLGALLSAALMGTVISNAMTPSQKQKAEALNQALKRLKDFIDGLKSAAQATAVTVASATALVDLVGLLRLPGGPKQYPPLSDRAAQNIKAAIQALLLKYPGKCPELERVYKSKLGGWFGKAYTASNMARVWENFIEAALALVKCLLKGITPGPPGAHA
jgi:hypothetical protein